MVYINKENSGVNPRNTQSDIATFQSLGPAARSVLKQILLTRYANGYASMEDTQRLIDQYELWEA